MQKNGSAKQLNRMKKYLLSLFLVAGLGACNNEAAQNNSVGDSLVVDPTTAQPITTEPDTVGPETIDTMRNIQNQC